MVLAILRAIGHAMVVQILSVVDNPVLIGPFLKKFLQGPTADSSQLVSNEILTSTVCITDWYCVYY